jgi:hypothetical protein
VQKLVLTSSASEKIKTFNICNSADFESIITMSNEKLFSGAFHFTTQHSIIFSEIKAEMLLTTIMPFIKNEESTNDNDRGSIPNPVSVQQQNLWRHTI